MNITSQLTCLLLLLVSSAGPSVASEAPSSGKPRVTWTAGDAPDFRYQFLEDVRTTRLWYATPETGTFSHHGFLAYFKGVMFAVWDSQARDENTSGQHGVFRHSTDEGGTWSEARPLFPPLADNVPAARTPHPNPFQTSQGFVPLGDRLYAVTCVDRELKEKVYRFNEVARVRIGFLAREVRVDGTLGEIFWLADSAPRPEPGYPAYPAGDPAVVARLKAYFREPATLPQLLFGPREYPDSDDEKFMNEPCTPWRLDNGTWVRLYRDEGSIHAKDRAEVDASKSRRNYAAFSFDGGKTWTAPTWTNFPDTCSRSNSGRLPDGRYYVINDILPMAPRPGGRSMLAISLSRDGLNFDCMAVLRFISPPQRHEGKAKSIGYQYPHSVVVKDHLWVIYSVNKEDMEVARVPLAELAKISPSSHRPLNLKRR
ncbi:MAG: hypothetical protein FJ399_08810 [Verrucomicrobia bacterium]|nr:hypothetical protein [Verrucomicrobiota bacterium]